MEPFFKQSQPSKCIWALLFKQWVGMEQQHCNILVLKYRDFVESMQGEHQYIALWPKIQLYTPFIFPKSLWTLMK
jgi:hypothetical protein